MIRLALPFVLAAALSLPASAVPDPSALVLRASDVPSGFRIDRTNTGLRTNAHEAKSDPRFRTLFRRWGRVTGYQGEFVRRGQTISARVDLFETRSGARRFLDWYVREVRLLGIRGLALEPVQIGAQGWVYGTKQSALATIVVWRFGRAFGGVAGIALSRERTLALARTQQRRMASALR